MADVLDDVGILGVSVEMLSDSIFDVGVEMLSDMEIIVLTTSVITLGFVVGVTSTVDVLTIVITDVVSVIDMFAENGLAAVVTALEFSLSSP